MSYLSFPAESGHATRAHHGGSLRSAYSDWILANHGGRYRRVVQANRTRPTALRFGAELSEATPESPTDQPLVGIVGGGFAGLFAGLILQSLGIEFEIFESSDRVGGRIDTWYSPDYDPTDPDKAGLYGEVGGMRLPQFSADMLPVQQLGLAVNAVLERCGLSDQAVTWRKFYYNSPEQRLRYNNMAAPITAKEVVATSSTFNFGRSAGGDLDEVWVSPKEVNGTTYLPINQVLAKVNQPFIDAINVSFASGFDKMMQFDQYSMWDYLTTVFTLGELGEYYDPRMGAKSDFLPWSVASFLETTNVGTGMYGVSFVEMVIAIYDWGGSKDPYHPEDESIYMLTVDRGMQRFPDACATVLNLDQAVQSADGVTAQVQVGMLPGPTGTYSYTAPNLTTDALPPGSTSTSTGDPAAAAVEATTHQRVFLGQRVVQIVHDPALYDAHGGMILKVDDVASGVTTDKTYPYVITTVPNGDYLNGRLDGNLLDGLSFEKAQAIRECNYMSAFKAFITFTSQFWTTPTAGQGLGAAATDRPNRQIVYPSYGYDATGGVLQVYCWDEDARRLGALSDEERVNECLKGIQYLYPEVDVASEFAGYDNGRTTFTWFWDRAAGGGAFTLFNPGQYSNMYPALLTPEFDGCLNFAGEACSVHHGWIVGALDSAYNAVYHVLQQAGATDQIEKMKTTWGEYAPPDIGSDASTANVLEYAYDYNEVDRRADSVAPEATSSIYGESTYRFDGQVPPFVADFTKVPQSMKKTARDAAVLAMLNAEWDDNVAMRAEARAAAGGPPAPQGSSAVDLLESTYYADNFQTIPAPGFWLKDDDEFARQQLGGFMPDLLAAITLDELAALLRAAAPPNVTDLATDEVLYVADYRQYLSACTVTPTEFYLASPIVFYGVDHDGELAPLAIQLDPNGELFTPDMANAENAWLLAKMQTNGAGQTLHDVGFHQLYTHQLAATVSISLFSEEVFTPAEGSGPAFQQHPVFKLLRPHLVKTSEFQQTIYNRAYDPYYKPFPATLAANGSPGVYNLGFVYDLIFSCGRIGNYQLQDRMFNNGFEFLQLDVVTDAARRGVDDTPFSYPYVHDASLYYEAQAAFVGQFVDRIYPAGDSDVTSDAQLQRFFSKLIPAFNHDPAGAGAHRFPDEVTTASVLKNVLTVFVWQFSVHHTVVNDGAYNQAAFVPNASTLMRPLPTGASSTWTPQDVLDCLPSQTATYPQLGDMTFTDIQINASVTGQGPYPETVLGRGVIEPSIDFLQDSYNFVDRELRAVVDNYYERVLEVGREIRRRQAVDTARYLSLHPDAAEVPATVTFDLIEPGRVMSAIQT